jgi:hypothetical protein
MVRGNKSDILGWSACQGHIGFGRKVWRRQALPIGAEDRIEDACYLHCKPTGMNKSLKSGSLWSWCQGKVQETQAQDETN